VVIDEAAARIEEAGLNAVQTQRQLFHDGWLLRLSPGTAKRGRSVQSHFGSTLPLVEKIAHCERVYHAHELPTLFRITPFSRPAELDGALARRGYVAFDPTLVQAVPLAARIDVEDVDGVDVTALPMNEFVEAVGELRGSSAAQRAAHLERFAHTPLAVQGVVARIDGRTVASGQVTREDSLAGLYDMVTTQAMRGRGIATSIVAVLLTWARERGATQAYLQVNEDNAAALAVYRKFGFRTVYAYHYRARPDECHST
jgi:GNAT superfamily N-acetyltransferase